MELLVFVLVDLEVGGDRGVAQRGVGVEDGSFVGSVEDGRFVEGVAAGMV